MRLERLSSTDYVKAEMEFTTAQLRRPVFCAYSTEPDLRWSEVGIRAVVTAQEGLVDENTDPFCLPHYILKKNN